MTTKTTTRLTQADRSALLAFADLSDALREARAALDSAERKVVAAESAAMQVLATKGAQVLHGRTYSLGETMSLKTIATDSELAEFARANGLKVSSPKPESCATATLRSAAIKGLDVSAVCAVTTTPTVILT